jgi:hypothetical protein
MNKKLKVTLVVTTSISCILGLIIIVAPLTTQQLIASWTETSYQEYVTPNEADQIKLLGPASSRPNLVQ